MGYTGIIHGNSIQLDQEVSIPDGTRVQVDVVPRPAQRRGSPAAILELVGTLTPAEADAIAATASSFRHVDAH